MKKIIFILIFILFTYNITEAKIRIHGGGGAIMRAGVKSYISSNNRSYLDFTSSDKETCGGDYSKDNFLCDSLDSFSITNKEDEIQKVKLDLENTYVNEYDQGSVNYYNNKVNNYNTIIKEHNDLLKEKCINVEEFCRLYECNKKYPGTIYKKIENKCLCENGQEYNEALGKKEGNGCKILLQNNQSDKNTTENTETKTDIKQSYSNSKSSNIGGTIFGILILIWIGSWIIGLFKK